MRARSPSRNAGFSALCAALATLLVVTLHLGTALAGPYEDGFEAYQRGDYVAAMRIIRPLANQGIADAQSLLGHMYYAGQGAPQNYAQALEWLRRAADQGDADAQNTLGAMYTNGQGVPQNQLEATKWYRKAADHGHRIAQENLGASYYFGQGVRQSYAEALKWFRKAANQGYFKAQYGLGAMYTNGQGVPQNHAEAAKWYRKAAEQGYAYAQGQLGLMYYNGQGVPKNYGEAFKWYRKAAEQGYAYAQGQLGLMYYNGKNYAEAVKWFRKAANQGLTAAQFSLGFLYEQGRGVPQNYAEAHMWYNLAASGAASDKKKHALFAQNRDLLANKMTRSQLAQAQMMADQCLRSNYTDCGWPSNLPPLPEGFRLETQPNETNSPPPRHEVTSTGTGFFVSQNGHIVTNAHVADGCQTVRASRGGTLRKISTDKASDLALYVASEKPNSFARLRGGRGAKAGEPVVAVGFPLSGVLSSDPIVTTGTISALSGLGDDRRQIQISAPVQPGNSGGPLLGEDGSVVGVVVGKLNALKLAEVIGDIPQNVNFAVSLGTLQSFLNANGVAYVIDDSKRTKSPADIAAEATRYTLLLECLR